MLISYRGKTKLIDKLVIDTGAAHTLITSDVVDDIGIYFEDGDPLVSSFGIGGEEYSFWKQVDFIKMDSYKIADMKLDFDYLGDWDINGLIGLDILMHGRFIIDLGKINFSSKELIKIYKALP